jgi:nucleoredoxin
MQNNFETLLGLSLLRGTTPIPTTSLSENEVVGLYFSGHWCPPCRAFTPMLKDIYNKLREGGKKFEIVFVSSDHDQTTFDEYYEGMPWLALPFSESKLNAMLNKKFRVSGIPTLVLLNSHAELITSKGRSAVQCPEQFPWPQPTYSDIMNSCSSFLSHNGPVGNDVVLGKEYLGLYFSASWCPPCQNFTPKLAQVYNKLQAERQDFEFIFFSADENETDFQNYYEKMPFLACAFDQTEYKSKMMNHFGVTGFPTLVMVDRNGNIISSDATVNVHSDPDGLEFPWKPKPVNSIDNLVGIEATPGFIVLMDSETKEVQDRIEHEVNLIAKEWIEKDRIKGEDQSMLFFVGRESDGLIERVRTLYGGKKGETTKVIILDFPDNGIYVYDGEVCIDGMKQFLCEYQKGGLTKLPIQFETNE